MESQRLDKWLWCARFAATRTACAGMAESGLVRINRQPTDKPHAKVRVGDVLTLPLYAGVRVVEVRGLSERRGPAEEARCLYADRPGDGDSNGDRRAARPDAPSRQEAG